ncbi:MAG: hypothetical protein IIU61_01680, partial [Alistipes sp.]|nr:hypothetical protein [Alistipes sp.]
MNQNDNESIIQSVITDSHAENQPAESHHDDDILPSGDNSQRRRHFKWYDVIVILLFFFLSQGIGAFISVAIGVTPPDAALLKDSDFEIVENAESQQARFVAVTFAFAIAICFTLLTIYRILRKWESHISFRSPSWGAPFRLLCGYLFLWCVSITLEPLTSILPSDQSALGA